MSESRLDTLSKELYGTASAPPTTSRLDALSEELYGRPPTGEGYQPAAGPTPTHDVEIVTRESSGPPGEPLAQRGFQQTSRGLSLPQNVTGLLTPVLRSVAGEQTPPAGPPGSTATIGGYTVPAKGALPTGMGQVGGWLGGPVGSGVGAGAGLYIERKLRGEPVTAQEVGIETALSFLPEAAESTVRGVARHVARATRGGHQLRLDEVARRAQEVAPKIFDAPERAAVSQLFEDVRTSGVRMNVQPMVDELQRLPMGKYDALLSEVQKIDNDRKTGGRFTTLLRELRQGSTAAIVQGADIGDLQDLHSALRVRGEAVRKVPEASQLLSDFNTAIDDAITTGTPRTPGGGAAPAVPEQLMEARRQWARVRSAEDLSELLSTSPVSRSMQGGRLQSFNLDMLLTQLKDNRRPLAQKVNRALARTPEAATQFNTFLNDMRQILPEGSLQISDTSGLRRFAVVAGLDRMLSHILTSPRGQALFRDAIIQGRGRLSINGLAEIASAVRREEYGAGKDVTGTTAPPATE